MTRTNYMLCTATLNIYNSTLNDNCLQKRPSSLHETISNCAEQNGSFITPPSTESMTNFMREKSISDASFLTPVQRHNSTHYSDGGNLRKLSDFDSTDLLSMNKTSKYNAGFNDKGVNRI